MSPPLVSVIIPVFQAAQYLKQCIDSVVNQSYKHLEIILVNDGSTDASQQIIDSFKKKDTRIKSLFQENQGPGKARNLGLKEARGDYVLFVDGDDYIDQTLVEETLNFTISENVDMTIFGIHGFKLAKKKIYSGKQAAKYLLTKNHFYNSSCNKFFASNIQQSNKIYFSDEKIGEDILFIFHIIVLSNRVLYQPKSYYHYRVVNTSITQNIKHESIIDLVSICQKIMLKTKAENIYKTFCLPLKFFVLSKKFYLLNQIHALKNKTEKKKLRKTLKNEFSVFSLFSWHPRLLFKLAVFNIAYRFPFLFQILVLMFPKKNQ